MFFVAGITGNVGGAAARKLLEEGRSVRALARDPQKAADWAGKGVDVRQGDFNDSAAVAAALEGVEGAFLMIPPNLAPSPGFPEAKAIIASFQESLRQSPPPRLALLSSFGSEQTSGLGLITTTRLLEEALADLPIPTAVIRPGGFLENYLAGLQTAAATGISYSFYQPLDRPIPMTATVDIGNEIARLLMEGWSGKRIVEIGTPTTPLEIAQAMTEALNRPVEAQAIPRDRWTATLESFGLPPATVGPYEEMMDGANSGWIRFGVPSTEHVPGTTTPTQVFTQTMRAQSGD